MGIYIRQLTDDHCSLNKIYPDVFIADRCVLSEPEIITFVVAKKKQLGTGDHMEI